MKIDFLYEPPMFQVSDTHFAKTWLLHAQARPYTDALDREGIKGTEPLRSSRPAEGKEPPLLSVKNLTVNYKLGRRTFCAVNDVSFDIHAGETFSWWVKADPARPLSARPS